MLTEQDRSAWKLDDKVWKKERRASWNILKDKIRNTTLNRRMTKYLKAYYMEGVLPNDPNIPEAFLVFYRMWLHPDQSKENLEFIFKEITSEYDYRYCVKLFKEFGNNVLLKLGEDGILGGHEAIYAHIIFPDIYTDEKIEFENGYFLPRCFIHKESFFSGFCVSCSYLLLDQHYYKNEYRQFMVDFWFSIFGYGDLTRPEIDWLFRATYYFDEVGVDDGPEGNRRRFAENLKEALDNRELPAPLADKWAWIKTSEGKVPTEAEVALFKGWQGQ